VDGAVAGAEVALLAGAELAGLDTLGELGADDELGDDEQLATAARTISAPATWPTRPAGRFPLPDIGNTPVPPSCGATCAAQLSMTVGRAHRLYRARRRVTP
jgi:hypothetical protein